MTSDIHQVERDLLHRIRTEGVTVAYETALAVCRDPKSTSPAKATAAATLFRVAGYFKDQEREGDKDPSEMDGHELRRAIRQLENNLKERQSRESDIFR